MKFFLTVLLFVGCFVEDPGQSENELAVRELLDLWRESVEFDLPGEVLREEAEMLERYPALVTNGEALDIRVHARLLTEDPGSAADLIANSKIDEAGEPFVRIASARIALFEDKLDEVVSILQQKDQRILIDLCEPYADAWLLLGRAHARAGRNSVASTMLHQFIVRDPFHPETPSAWHQLARNAFERGSSTEAAQFRAGAQQAAYWQKYYRARRLQVRENPKAVLPRIGLVILWMQADKPVNAKRELTHIFELDPDNCEAFGHLAEAERKLENFDEARIAYDKALECAPDKVGLRFNRAYLAKLQSRWDDARKDYEWIVESEHAQDTTYLDAHLELARILASAGDLEAAEARYETYRDLGGEAPLTP